MNHMLAGNCKALERFPDAYRHCQTYAAFLFWMVHHKSNFTQVRYEYVCVCVYIYMVNYMCIDKDVQLESKPQNNEPDQPQHNCPAACIITQQYSSATFASLHFRSHKEKFIMSFRTVI